MDLIYWRKITDPDPSGAANELLQDSNVNESRGFYVNSRTNSDGVVQVVLWSTLHYSKETVLPLTPFNEVMVDVLLDTEKEGGVLTVNIAATKVTFINAVVATAGL